VFLPSLEEKWKRCEDDPSPPSDSEIKNAWSCTLKCKNFIKIIYTKFTNLFSRKISWLPYPLSDVDGED